ncbi:MAG: rRNA adenine N-6-methyltransferase family protein [Nanoarchaeota archaeon]
MGTPDLGEHFLIDKKVIAFIIDNAALQPSDVVLEIGPGRGALTFELAKHCQVIAVEISDEHYDRLKEEIKKRGTRNVTLVNANILDIIDTLQFTKIVANIPYSISEPLFYQLAKKDFQSGIITCGENFYQVLKGKTKTGILFAASYDVEKIKELKKTAFYPPPKTNSCIICVRKKSKPTPKELLLQHLLRLDQKKIQNALEKIFENALTKKELAQKIREYAGGEKKKAGMFSKKLQALSNNEMNFLLDFLEQK